MESITYEYSHEDRNCNNYILYVVEYFHSSTLLTFLHMNIAMKTGIVIMMYYM